MNYVCHCGASLRYEPAEKRWLCPQGHQVYACAKCAKLGKSVPLQWIPQYQRWYCYECREYASTSSSSEKSEEASIEAAEESEEEDDEDLIEEEHNDEEIGQYALGIVQGSRIDDFCFLCRNLEFTQNNTHLRCSAGIPRYTEPLIQDITLRPTGAGKGVSGICGQMSDLSHSDSVTMTQWLTYFEEQTRKQIRSHEKSADAIEMYRIDLLGSNTYDIGAGAKRLAVNRDNLLKGVAVVIDKTNEKVWIHFPMEESSQKGFGHQLLKSALAITGSIEDYYSPRFLRDLLKRDIESFEYKKTFLGTESPDFWSVIDEGATQPTSIQPESVEHRKPVQGPRFRMYRIKYNLGTAQVEGYTGGKSTSETKWITLDPLKTSVEEFDPKKMIIVIDHENQLVWLWVGKRSALVKSFVLARARAGGAQRHQLAIIGSQIGENLSSYDFIGVEDGKHTRENEQFDQVLAQIRNTG